MKRNRIIVKTNTEKNKENIDYDNLDLIFESEDNTFIKGSVGFGVNGVDQVLIDKFSFKVEECS